MAGCDTQASWYGPYWQGGAPEEFGEVGSTTTEVMDELVGPPDPVLVTVTVTCCEELGSARTGSRSRPGSERS